MSRAYSNRDGEGGGRGGLGGSTRSKGLEWSIGIVGLIYLWCSLQGGHMAD